MKKVMNYQWKYSFQKKGLHLYYRFCKLILRKAGTKLYGKQGWRTILKQVIPKSFKVWCWVKIILIKKKLFGRAGEKENEYVEPGIKCLQWGLVSDLSQALSCYWQNAEVVSISSSQTFSPDTRTAISILSSSQTATPLSPDTSRHHILTLK